jgi:hypothetical protein
MKHTPKLALITTALAASFAFTACTSPAATPDGTAETAAAGTADLATDTPVPADAEVRSGSASKTFTAVAALQLVEEGRLGLDRSVETYVPCIIVGELHAAV